MLCSTKSPAVRRYTFRLMVAMGFYVVLLPGVLLIFKHFHPSGLAAYALALLPALPIVAVMAVVGIYLTEEKDEFQRTVLVQSMLWAIGLTLSAATLWGFLELILKVPHFQLYLAFPVFWVMVAFSAGAVTSRYK